MWKTSVDEGRKGQMENCCAGNRQSPRLRQERSLFPSEEKKAGKQQSRTLKNTRIHNVSHLARSKTATKLYPIFHKTARNYSPNDSRTVLKNGKNLCSKTQKVETSCLTSKCFKSGSLFLCKTPSDTRDVNYQVFACEQQTPVKHFVSEIDQNIPKVCIDGNSVSKCDNKTLRSPSKLKNREAFSSPAGGKVFPVFLSKESSTDLLFGNKKKKAEGNDLLPHVESKICGHSTENALHEDIGLEDERELWFPLISFVDSAVEDLAASCLLFPLKKVLIFDGSVGLIWHRCFGLIDHECSVYISSSKNEEVGCLHNVGETETVFAKKSLCDKEVNLNLVNEAFPAMWNDRFCKLYNDKTITAGVREKFCLWLSRWKERYAEEKHLLSSSDASFDSRNEHKGFETAVLISGPTGCGKTSLVHHIARELGFIVLEVNASSCRSGRYITSQIQEAISSYHMEGSKHTETLSSLHGFSTGTAQNETVIDSSVEPLQRNFSVLSNPELPFKQRKRKKAERVSTASSRFEIMALSECNEQHKTKGISTMTLILFDDVDVVFDKDVGFWNAINCILENSKKPVVLTVTQNLEEVASKLMHPYEYLKWVPDSNYVCNMLANHCKFQNIAVPSFLRDIAFLNGNDARRCLVNLHFWKGNIPLAHFFNDLVFADQALSSKASLWVSHGIDLAYDKFYKILERVQSKIQAPVSFESRTQSAATSTRTAVKPNLVPLCILSSALGEFCQLDHFKAELGLKTSKWLSVQERMQDWNAGLPPLLSQNEILTKSSELELISMCSTLMIQKCVLGWTGNWLEDSASCNVFSDKSSCHFFRSCYAVEEKICCLYRTLPLHQQYKGCNSLTDYYFALRNIASVETARAFDTCKRSRRFCDYFKKIGLNIEIHSFI